LLIALWPRHPIAVSRIWCIYELWCAIELKIPIIAGVTDENRRRLILESCCSIWRANRIIHVDIEIAQATKIEDIQLIISKIRESPGVAEVNKQV
jgi:hypothetical protein